MCVYVCECVRVFVCVCVCICICVFVCIYVSVGLGVWPIHSVLRSFVLFFKHPFYFISKFVLRNSKGDPIYHTVTEAFVKPYTMFV